MTKVARPPLAEQRRRHGSVDQAQSSTRPLFQISQPFHFLRRFTIHIFSALAPRSSLTPHYQGHLHYRCKVHHCRTAPYKSRHRATLWCVGSVRRNVCVIILDTGTPTNSIVNIASTMTQTLLPYALPLNLGILYPRT